jgi:fibronectin-binding autotransporter adhesin
MAALGVYMVKNYTVVSGKARSSARALILTGTALGCSLAASTPATAQAVGNITYTGAGPYVLTQTVPVVGGPRAIDVTVTSGDATVDTTATTVTTTNNGNTTGTAVGVNNTGAGNVTVRTGDLTANGSGVTNAIDTRATTGATTIVNAGTINASGNNGDRAISALSGGGNVTISSNVANGQRFGVYVGGNGGTFGDTSTVTINSTNATANGTGVVNAIVAQGYRVVVNSGTATNTNAGGNSGTAIFANAGAGGVLLNAGTTNAFGQNQAAMQIFSEGAVDVTSGTVRTTQNSDGVSIASGTDVVVRSTSITTEGTGGARGIVIGGNAGGGGFNSGANGFAYTSANVTSGSITTAGQNAYGIYVTPTGTGTTTITSRDITTTGANAYGIFETAIGNGSVAGASTINSTGQLRTGNAIGIQVLSGPGAVTINNSGAITAGASNTAGTTIGGILVAGGANATGAVTITSNAITATGTGGFGIQVNGTSGPVTVTSNAMTAISGISVSQVANATGALSVTNTGALATSGTNGYGVYVAPTGGATTVTNNGAITTTGNFGHGVFVGANAAGVTVVGSGSTTTSGTSAYGVFVNGTTGGSNVTAGTITTSGANAIGINVTGTTGAASVASTNVSTSGNGATGIFLRSTTGALTVNSGTATTTADSTSTILAQSSNGGNISITAGTTTSGGIGVNGVSNAITGQSFGTNTTGTVTVVSGSATANGGAAIAALGGGNVVVNSGTARSVGGLVIQSSSQLGDVTVDAATTTLVRSPVFNQNAAISAVANRGNVTVRATTVTADNGGGIVASGANAVAVAAGTTRVSGTNATAISATSSAGLATVASTDLAVVNGRGIFASGALGATVTSGTLAQTVSGAADYALLAQVSTPAQGSTLVPTGVTVNSGTITSDVGGIRTSSLTAGTNVTSGSVTTAGIDVAGIYAVASTGNVGITSGTVAASGAGGGGIYASTSTGNIAITATNTTTTGALSEFGNSSDAILAFTNTGATGTGTINIISGTASAQGQFASAIFARGGGNVTVTSGTATSAGNTNEAIGVISANADATLTATTTRATGVAANAVTVTATRGNATVNVGTATASSGRGVNVTAGQLAAVTATTASAGGDGNAAVNIVGGTGVTLNVGSATSTGTATSTTNANTGVTTIRRADAIYAAATNGAINATVGSASATGAGADAVRLIANGTGGAVTAGITGQLSSTSGYGLFIDPPGAVVVNVGAAASIAGGLGGISTVGATNTITNLGSITSTGGTAIQAVGATTLVNSGRLSGASGVAVQLGAANDSVTLATGSNVIGRIVGGGGSDAAILVGSSNAATATQTVAGFDGFDSLTVQSGYWSANAANSSSVNTATINANATLALVNGATGLTGVTAGRFVDNGTLVVQSSAASAGSTFGASTVTGSGNLLLTGAGTVTLDRTNTITTTGTTTVDGGSTLLVTGTQGGTIVTTANGTLQVGSGGTTGAVTGSVVNNGQLLVNRSDDTTFAAGLSGAGNFVKQGAGKLTFGTNYAFTGVTTIQAGSIRLSTPVAANTEIALEGAGQLDLSGTAQTIAELAGTSNAASINIAGGSLTVNQATNTSFAGALVGAGGSFTKAGLGTLNLTGNSTYTGPTNVNGGRLSVNGSIVSPVTVNSGGTLGGTGRVGTTTIASGGTFAPGNSIGTITVAGNVTFAAGSIYQVEANAAGAADRINATGAATLGGGTVQVLAATGSYARLTDYTILTAAGGVSGRFTGVTSNLAFLTPRLNYAANAVSLTLARNDVAFATLAATGNQAAVAGAIAARGNNDAIFNSVLFSDATTAQATFGALTGEINASLPTELIDNGRRVREAVLARGRSTGDGLGMWATGLQSYADSRREGGLGRLAANRTGVIGGVDYTVNGVRIGVNGGYQDDDIRLRGRGSSASVKTTFGGLNVAYLQGPLEIQAGANYAWHDIDAQRTLGVTGLATAVAAQPDANSAQLFAEVGYGFTTGQATITPFLRNAYTWSRVKAYAETGGLGALTVGRDRRDVDFASAGVRMTGNVALSPSVLFLPHGSIAYQRGFGDLRGVAIQRIGGTGPAFAITGASLGKDTLTLDGGFDLLFGQGFTLGVGAFGSTSKQWADRGAKASIGFRF